MSDYQCPTCQRSFDTQRGRSVHHSSVHNEPLPNRTCAYCEGPFHSPYKKKHCSGKCLAAAQPYAGKNNPNYQNKAVETDCTLCGTSFTYYPSNKEGKFCAECVETRNWQDSPHATGKNLTGANNPNWVGGKQKVECTVCGTVERRYPSNISGDITVCSEECRRAWLSEAFTGSGHPNWKGGPSTDYGQGWNRVRAAALERDEYECQLCGKGPEAIGRNPDVHHIVPVRWFRNRERVAETAAHSLDNVVSLCITCHRRADHGKVPDDVLYSVAGIDEPVVGEGERGD